MRCHNTTHLNENGMLQHQANCLFHSAANETNPLPVYGILSPAVA